MVFQTSLVQNGQIQRNVLKRKYLHVDLCISIFLILGDSSSQVTNEHLGIGKDTWVGVAELEQEYDTKPVFTAGTQFDSVVGYICRQIL